MGNKDDIPEMVERVARAINEVANKRFNAYFVDKAASLALARAAIMAMSEPTEAMVDQGAYPIRTYDVDSLGSSGGDGTRQTADAWRAMIAAALRKA